MALGVGAFRAARRRTIRAPVNPIDKCTLVSIFPRDVHERKLTLQPGEFHIPAGSYENPSLLVIGPSSWWRDVGDDEPLLEIPQSSSVMAESIVRDYLTGMIACNMRDSMPGLFWLPGEVLVEELKLKYKPTFDKAHNAQLNYWSNLIRLADALWARTQGNPLAVPDMAKLACHELKQARDWAKTFVAQEVVRCVACGSIRNPAFPVCPTCKAVIDPDKAKELKIKFAE
jgi:hypothetical protein